MFEREAKGLTDYTGLKVGAILLPMLLLFAYFGKEDMGLAIVIVLAMMTVAIKIRWNLRKHIWFWAIIVFVLALHVPLFFMVRWPQGNVPTLFFTLPFAIADFMIISGILRLAEKLLSKDSLSNAENE
jgi:hypothetical protein